MGGLQCPDVTNTLLGFYGIMADRLRVNVDQAVSYDVVQKDFIQECKGYRAGNGVAAVESMKGKCSQAFLQVAGSRVIDRVD